MNLKDRDKPTIRESLEQDLPLPAKHRTTPFAASREVKPVWQGSTSEVTGVVLPLRSIEHIEEPRAGIAKHADGVFEFDCVAVRQDSGPV